MSPLRIKGKLISPLKDARKSINLVIDEDKKLVSHTEEESKKITPIKLNEETNSFKKQPTLRLVSPKLFRHQTMQARPKP